MGIKATPAAERLPGKYTINEESGCWEWTAGLDHYGYGIVTERGHPLKAHRISYMHHVGPIPDGLELDHLCRNKRCVNPAHLEPVTHAENVRRTMKEVCPAGHDRAMYSRIRKNGGRQCGECARQRSLDWYYRVKSQGLDPNALRKAKQQERRAV